jgi:GNAT superfamily N-acetyltransferase
LGTVTRALQGSYCVGAYLGTGAQIGLVRVISDYATYAYLCDVYVLEAHRGKGLAKAMLEFAMGEPALQGMRTWNLRTRDAQGLYAQLGFQPIENPGGYMIRRSPDVYKPT